jgi:uncharacterized protein (DUF1697 family)
MGTTYVALLRSVNVAGHGSMKMDELRDVVRGLGFGDVSTYIQSGNVIFTSDAPVRAERVAQEIGSAVSSSFGTVTVVALRSRAELERVVRSNPFAHADPATLHVGFLARRPPARAVRELDLGRFDPEQAVVKGTEAYFHLPNGMGRAKLPDHVGRRLDVPMTVRNWRTVTKLVELTAS